jgi:hypothetical protein
MTRHELIDAFVSGQIGRRDFVRGLTALGVSAGAALAYSNTLAPKTAAAGRQSSPYVMRFQAQEDVYGTVCTLNEVEAATAVAAAEQEVSSILEGILADFDQSDIPFINALEVLNDHVSQHIDVLNTMVTDLGGTPPTPPPQPTYTDVDTAFDELIDALGGLTQLFTGVVPATANGERRQARMGIAMNLNKHLGYILALRNNPSPGDIFERANCP